jgi:hypothetical protein
VNLFIIDGKSHCGIAANWIAGIIISRLSKRNEFQMIRIKLEEKCAADQPLDERSIGLNLRDQASG